MPVTPKTIIEIVDRLLADGIEGDLARRAGLNFASRQVTPVEGEPEQRDKAAFEEFIKLVKEISGVDNDELESESQLERGGHRTAGNFKFRLTTILTYVERDDLPRLLDFVRNPLEIETEQKREASRSAKNLGVPLFMQKNPKVEERKPPIGGTQFSADSPRQFSGEICCPNQGPFIRVSDDDPMQFSDNESSEPDFDAEAAEQVERSGHVSVSRANQVVAEKNATRWHHGRR